MKERKCLFVTISGLPNSGKSTMFNNIVGKKIAIVTPKSQTTRTKIKGIVNNDYTQIIFTDSPGIFPAKTKLEKTLINSAWSAIRDGDITLLLIDVSNYLSNMDKIKNLLIRLKQKKERCILVINKTDLIKKSELMIAYKNLNLLYKFEKFFAISALKRDRLFDLISYLSKIAPVSPWFYKRNQVTDSSVNFLSAEITREKLFLSLRQEIPYSIAVITEQIQKKKYNNLIIRQILFVIKDSHKKIVLGKKGKNIKKINIMARIELEKLFNCKIHLFLFVKVHHWIEYPKEYISDV